MRYRKKRFALLGEIQLNKFLQRILVILSLVQLAIIPSYSQMDEITSRQLLLPVSSPNPISFLSPRPVHSFATAKELAGQTPLFFEENCGQLGSSAKYQATCNGQKVLLTSTGLLWKSKSKESSLQMRLVNGSAKALSEGLSQLSGKVNYFLSDRNYTDIPTYAQVKYHTVYQGIDLVYYFNDQKLEYDFIVSPGADVSQIRLAFNGAKKMLLNENGDLSIRTTSGELRHHKPFAYQFIDGRKQEVQTQFRKTKNGEIQFEVAPYDTQQTLIIDPTVSYVSYLGGSDYDIGTGITVDSGGNIYVAGVTSSIDFPTSSSAYQRDLKDTDVFITKFDPTGRTVIYSTFLGGANLENATGIALDTVGNVYVTGSTTSSDFPTTAGAYKRTVDRADAFVTKLNTTGSGLVFSTVLGGTGNETSQSIAVDSANNAYVTGSTTSSDFPATSGVFQNNSRGGSFEAFVTKFNSTGTQLVYSSYLGGSANDEGLGIVVDSGSNAYVTGYTYSSNFPATTGAYQTTLNGGTNLSDAFIAKVNAAGSALTYATYLGGRANDTAYGIAIDAAGNAYVTGTTLGSTNDFPTTAGAFQRTYQGSSIPGPASDAFVTKLNSNGTALVYSTYIGGNGADQAFGIAVNAQGSAFITGSTGSTNFPLASDGFRNYAGAIDAFVVQLDAAGATVPFTTYLGGNGSDAGIKVAVDNSGAIHVVGNTSSITFPTFPNAYQPTSNGTQSAFFATIREATSLIATTALGASYRTISMARESIVSVFGGRLATRMQASTPGQQLPTTLAGTTVKVKDRDGVERLAPLFFASPTQVNYQIPPGTAVGGALVTVTAEDGTISIGTIQVVDISPDVFSADSTGKGPAIGNAVRVKANGAQSEEAIVRYVNNQPELIPIDLGPDTEQVILILYGTGIRFRKDPPQVTATIGGVSARVDYARNQCCFVGLDQINLLIPRALIGRGQVDVVVTVDGQPTLPLQIAIK